MVVMAGKLVLFLGACALLRATSVSALHNNDNVGIVGGDEVSINEVPYMALVYISHDDDNYIAVCGGSIVHERFILTAAHCINSVFISSRMVRVGSDLLDDGVQIGVEKTLCYNSDSKYSDNDICLLKLSSRVPLGEKVALVQLPDKNTNVEDGTEVNVTGWGVTSNNLNSDMSDKLRRTTIPVVSWTECSKTYPEAQGNMFCAGSTGNNACMGDSGGPMTYNNVQIGVTKGGRRNIYQYLCGISPGLYIRVAVYVDWINSTITENL